jgi:phytoene dehydrogenase-like protein
LDATVTGLGVDGAKWRRLFARFAAGFGELNEDVLRSMLHVPKHPIRLASFGTRALLPATAIAHRFATDEARALFGGAAAHAFRPLNSIGSASVGLALITSAHAVGWPVPKGGSRAISDALAAMLIAHGGRIETGVHVTVFAELPSGATVLLDTSPRDAVNILGDRLPARVRRAYERYRYGPASFKVDLAVQGGLPWTNADVRRAGTVHLGGRFEELAAAEHDVAAGRMPERPFVLVAQQYLADPSRSADDVHPIWAYAHVPHGYDGDATEAVLSQIERFAPGARERIVAMATKSPAQLEAANANYIGGDIVCGANDLWQVIVRPRLAVNPYATGVPGVYMCSAATPPGAGIHGMCGLHAATLALHRMAR